MGKETRNPVSRVDWKSRAIEAETALEHASKALDLVPVGPLEAGQTWFPSETAIALLKRAKDSVAYYIEHQWHGGGRP